MGLGGVEQVFFNLFPVLPLPKNQGVTQKFLPWQRYQMDSIEVVF